MLSTLSTSISNLVSLLLHSLKFSSLFPALVFVVLNEGVALLSIAKHRSINLFNDNNHALTLLVFSTLLFTVLIGYMLNVLNFSIISFFEGYPFRLTWFGGVMTYFQMRRRRKLKEKVEELRDFIAKELPKEVVPDEQSLERFLDWIERSDLFKFVEREKAVYQTKLETYFPSHESAVAPSALGNAIAAFEEYPKTRYGIDAVFLWPRLTPILSQEKYAIFVEKEKAGLDFLLNLSLLVGIFGIECVVLKLAGIAFTALIPAAAFLSAYFLYRGAIQAASNWGETVKVAFDSYRYQLAHRLSIKPFHNKREEFARWYAVSQFIIQNEAFDKFDYPLPKEPQPKREK
jgi:hypothetical protein